jgi:ribosomal protein L11 methyltransferase
VWISAVLTTDAEHAEALSEGLFAQGAISVTMEDADAGTDRETPQFGEPGSPETPLWQKSRVVALFDPADDIIGRIARAAGEIGLTDLPEIELSEVGEQDWVRLTQAQFEPIRVNARLWIVPSWHVAPDPAAINLVLDPGLAFGTGSHPTTRLCLDWLCSAIRGGERVLDYGCGSGILALAAAKLGAGEVLGVDIDDHALEAAAENARTNQVDLHLAHSTQPLIARYDVVIANILTNPLRLLAPLLADRTAPGGQLVLSGVLEDQAALVIEAYAPFISLSVGAIMDGWARLQGRREAC